MGFEAIAALAEAVFAEGAISASVVIAGTAALATDMTIVGMVTGNEDLMKAGGVLGLVSGGTAIADGLGMFGSAASSQVGGLADFAKAGGSDGSLGLTDSLSPSVTVGAPNTSGVGMTSSPLPSLDTPMSTSSPFATPDSVAEAAGLNSSTPPGMQPSAGAGPGATPSASMPTAQTPVTPGAVTPSTPDPLADWRTNGGSDGSLGLTGSMTSTSKDKNFWSSMFSKDGFLENNKTAVQLGGGLLSGIQKQNLASKQMALQQQQLALQQQSLALQQSTGNAPTYNYGALAGAGIVNGAMH
jgi:hypothetical protein